MLSKFECGCGKKTGEGSSNSKSAPSSESNSKPKPIINGDASRKDKKSIWNWKPLRALSSHIHHKRFNCTFSLQVHLIEGLPSTLGDASLYVYWRWRNEILVTRPAKVVQGTAEFEEKLTFTCSVYGRNNGPNHSAKYEAKHSLLHPSILNDPEHDLGKHQVDLTRLLPLKLEDLEEEKVCGKWTTSFWLSGMAKGAKMNVSFWYMVVGDNNSANRDGQNKPNVSNMRQNDLGWISPDPKSSDADGKINTNYFGSLPSYNNAFSCRTLGEPRNPHGVSLVSKSAESSPLNILNQKFDEEKPKSLEHMTLDPIKPDNCLLSDPVKQKSHECAYNEEKTRSPMLDKPELDRFQESREPMIIDDHQLSDSGKGNSEECEGNEFPVTNQSVELLVDEQVEKSIKASDDASIANTTLTFDAAGIQLSSEDSAKHDSLDDKSDNFRDKVVAHECSYLEEDDLCTKELLMQELESALNRVSDFEAVALESPDVSNHMETKSKHGMSHSHSLDEIAESVTSEFLNMLNKVHSPVGLNSESEPESPRERLLRQFEKEALAEGFTLFDFDKDNEDEVCGYNASVQPFVQIEQWDFSDGPKSSSLLLQGHRSLESQQIRSKQRAQLLEGLETEALMRDWGLNEKAFQHSPPEDSDGFGSSVHLPPKEPFSLPQLAKGLGPFLQTKDGGFLRSMNPSLFRNVKNDGRLIIQVSNPVVVPAEMGSGIMEILQCLASMGIEKLSMQASKLMPLEDITGKTMQQLAWDFKPKRQGLLQHDSVKISKGTSYRLESSKFNSTTMDNKTGTEFCSLKDLAPLAMDKIEALSMEGLRIQSGMSDDDAPSNIIAQSIGDILAHQGKKVNISGSLRLDGSVGLKLLDIKDSSENVDGIMGLSLTLDEWMRLDSGEIDDIDNISEHTSKILAAHHANSFDLIQNSEGKRKRGKGPHQNCGLLGNNFTVALMVQLRDPLRNYEPVGSPMLSLIQAERVFSPLKPKIYINVPKVKNNYKYNHDDDESDMVVKVPIKGHKKEETSSDDNIPRFRITEVHVSGLTTEPHRKKLWGTLSQQLSGSRWLLANGMGKRDKHPLFSSKVTSKSSAPIRAKVHLGDTLWSISSRAHGTGGKWKETTALDPHIRNPNLIIPNKLYR